jgi:molybdate transport system substrate-binding protein
VRKIAIANPEHAPYGRAGVAALRHEQVYESVRSKLVMGENISQTAQFAQSGNAEVGLLSLSLALSPSLKSAGTYMAIPDSWHPAIEQGGVVVSASSKKTLARQFLDFLRTPDVVRMLRADGFATPPPAGR